MISSQIETWSMIETHPAAELFPMMSEDEYQGLLDDIHQHGQRQPIVMWQGMLLDGRNRLRACLELGIEPLLKELDEDDDPVAFVCSVNVHRRNLSTSQRGLIAAELCTMSRGGDRKSNGFKAQICASKSAAMTGVSERTVDNGVKVKEKAKPEVVAKVKAGKMSLNAAAKTIDPKPTYEVRTNPLAAIKKQIQALDDGPADELYRWMRNQLAPSESESAVIDGGPPLDQESIDLLGELMEHQNVIGVLWHWLHNAGPAKAEIVKGFCEEVVG